MQLRVSIADNSPHLQFPGLGLGLGYINTSHCTLNVQCYVQWTNNGKNNVFSVTFWNNGKNIVLSVTFWCDLVIAYSWNLTHESEVLENFPNYFYFRQI